MRLNHSLALAVIDTAGIAKIDVRIFLRIELEQTIIQPPLLASTTPKAPA